MRRTALFILALLLLSACGGKRARVSAPSLPKSGSNAELEGLASYYAEPYHGRRTASGEIFDTYKELTAAHRTLPFNTVVRVTNKNNGEAVDVRINDRGPFIDGRVIDLSLLAAKKIDLVRTGIAPVTIKVLKEGDGGHAGNSGSAGPALYAVQVGAFENLKNAEELKSKLERKYPSVNIQTLQGDKIIYRVRIGRESDLMAAEKLASQLRKEDINSFVVRLN